MDRPPSNREPSTSQSLPGDQAWLLQYYTSAKPDDGAASEGVPSLTPQSPNKYDARSPLGAGAEKEVVQVYDRDTLRDVALAKPRSGRSWRSFVREARILAHLEHPNIVPVHDLGTDSDGRPYFTMKLLAGETLDTVLRRLREGDVATLDAYPLSGLLEIFVRVCDAMAFAHSRGVIHRDLKPANIQIGAYGEVRVIDWGLAKHMGEGQDALETSDSGTGPETMLGTIKGTPGYMAPEQASGHGALADVRTDVYALGALLYAILTWQPPVVGATTEDLLRRTVAGERSALRPPVPGRKIPRALEAIACKALAVHPDDRYQTVDALLADLRAFLAGHATSVEDAGPFTLIWLVLRRHRALSIVSAISVLILTVVGIVAVARIRAGEQVAMSALANLQEEHAMRNRLGQAAVPRLLTEARKQMHAMNYEEALDTLSMAIGADPSHPEAWDLSGWIALGQEQFATAAAAFRHELDVLVEKPPVQPAHRTGRKGHLSSDDLGLRLAEWGDRFSNGGAHPIPSDGMQALANAGLSAGSRYADNARIMLGAYFSRHNAEAWTNDAHRALIQWAFQALNGEGAKLELRVVPLGLEAHVMGNKASDLLPLARLPLRRLDIHDTAVRDLQPLKGMPLQEIDLSNTEVVNMDALAASPLRVVSATGMRKLPEDLFTTCPALETVTVSSTTELPRRVTWPAQVKIIRK